MMYALAARLWRENFTRKGWGAVEEEDKNPAMMWRSDQKRVALSGKWEVTMAYSNVRVGSTGKATMQDRYSDLIWLEEKTHNYRLVLGQSGKTALHSLHMLTTKAIYKELWAKLPA